MAELAAITQLAQPRVSTHLAKLKEAGLVSDRRDGVHRLLKGRDPGKDQSYFLYTIGQAQLARTLFPVGELLKADVRGIAADAGLPVGPYTVIDPDRGTDVEPDIEYPAILKTARLGYDGKGQRSVDGVPATIAATPMYGTDSTGIAAMLRAATRRLRSTICA